MYHFQKSVVDSFNFKPSSGRADRSAIDPLTYKPHDTYPHREWFSSDFAPVLRVHTHMAQGTAKSGLQTAPDFHGGHPFKADERLPERFRMKKYDFGSGYPENASISAGTLMMARSRDDYYTGEGEKRTLHSREFDRSLEQVFAEFDKQEAAREAARKAGMVVTTATPASLPPITTSTQSPPLSLNITPITSAAAVSTTGGDSGVGGGGSNTRGGGITRSGGGKTSAGGSKASSDSSSSGSSSSGSSSYRSLNYGSKSHAVKKTTRKPITTGDYAEEITGYDGGIENIVVLKPMPDDISSLLAYLKSQTDDDIDEETFDKIQVELKKDGLHLHRNSRVRKNIIKKIKKMYSTATVEKATAKTTGTITLKRGGGK